LPLLRHVRHGDELNFSIFLVTPAEHVPGGHEFCLAMRD